MNYSACCNGLQLPNLPHLHASNCPTRDKDYVGPILFREDGNERRMFDDLTKSVFEGVTLKHIASSLDTWGRMHVDAKGHSGSYSQQCFIMANECLKAQDKISELEAALTKANKLIALLPADLVDHQRDLLEQNEPGYGV